MRVIHSLPGNVKILVEVGTFTNKEVSDLGFVLFDGTDTGKFTYYSRNETVQRWDWGPTFKEYSFVLDPDGSLKYYDFTEGKPGEATSAKEVYECKK